MPFEQASQEREQRRIHGGYKPWLPLPKPKFLGVTFLMLFWIIRPFILFPSPSETYSPPLLNVLRQLSAYTQFCHAVPWWSLLTGLA